MKSEKSLITGRIIDNREVAHGHYILSLSVPALFRNSMPGQFVMVRIKEREFPFLARPFSIYSLHSHDTMTVIEILYRVVGKGTEILSRLEADCELEVLGPLGTGFDIVPDSTQIILVAGGLGVAPLSFLAEYYSNQATGSRKPGTIICYFGAQTSKFLIGTERLKTVCSSVELSTDDGSEGYGGTVTELFYDRIDAYDDGNSIIYCCGPHPMMRKMSEILDSYTIPCQVSMEERMACGIGACLGCAVRVRSHEENPQYMRVCKEGPVFDLRLIDWR
jgi:dihydroorotate dehydrogenase electron transfer subunit